MTINDLIREEKPQYDVIREAAKISALSSGRIHKYEYLTGKDILPSNQQQIIEQTKFTYSPLGKAFEKQIKTIEDQGEKQIDALKNLKDQNKQLVNVDYDYEDKLLHLKEWEIFRNIYNKSLDKIEELTKKIDGSSLIFTTLITGETIDFTGKNDPLTLLKKIRDSKITLERAKELQEDLNNKKKPKRKQNWGARKNSKFNSLFNGRNEAIKFYDDYYSMILEAKKKAAEEQEGKGLKILTPKQMLQRLPIALAQVKAGNNSESLLNEIRQIVYSLYQSKQITKKVYNNIIESIQ